MSFFAWEGSLSSLNRLTEKGILLKKSGFSVFFSNDRFNLDDLQAFGIPFRSVKQVHGNDIIKATSQKTEADGLWTDQVGQALLIKTADCLPVFLSNRNAIMGVHVGWRGFVCNIFDKALDFFDDLSQVEMFIGPHIGFRSFEIDQKNAHQILDSQELSLGEALSKNFAKQSFEQEKHYFLNLKLILLNRARKMGVKSFYCTQIDTLTSPHHFSHRRNRQRVGTNYSFIIKNS